MSAILLSLFVVAATTSAASLSPRADSDTFSLFAYGASDSGIGGFPVVYINGYAYIRDQSAFPSDADIRVFFVEDSSTWIAQPNTTTSNATFTNTTFFVPGPSASSRQAGFSNTSIDDEDAITSGWKFYGHVALNEAPDGAWNSLFYAAETGTTGLWSLNWNATSDSNDITVTIKDTRSPDAATKGRG